MKLMYTKICDSLLSLRELHFSELVITVFSLRDKLICELRRGVPVLLSIKLLQTC